MKRITTPIIFIAAIVALAAVTGVSATACTTCNFPDDPMCWCGKELSRLGTDTTICDSGSSIVGVAADSNAQPITILCGKVVNSVFSVGATKTTGTTLNVDYVPFFASPNNLYGMNANSRGFGDWAVNRFKFECPVGYVVTGFSSDGSTGAITQMNCAPTSPANPINTYSNACNVVQWASVGLNSAGILLPPFGSAGGVYQSNYLVNTQFLVGVGFSSQNFKPEYYLYCLF